jgi:hypothetical protein
MINVACFQYIQLMKLETVVTTVYMTNLLCILYPHLFKYLHINQLQYIHTPYIYNMRKDEYE